MSEIYSAATLTVRLPKWLILIFAVALAIAAGVVITLALTNQGDDSIAMDSGDGETFPVGDCIATWNGAEHVGKLIAANGVAQGDVEASVNISADYGNRCLVTIAYPLTNTSFQLLETSGSEPFSIQNSGAPVASLPESVKNWNTEVSEDGSLSAAQP